MASGAATVAAQASAIPANACAQMVEAATRSCQPMISVPPEPANPNWDAVAVSLTSQSNAIAVGAVILAVIVAVAGIAWGKIITMNAEREARKEAQTEARKTAESEAVKWLAEEGFPFIRREMEEWRKTFPHEMPISENVIDAMVAAAGDTGKEDDDGKK